MLQGFGASGPFTAGAGSIADVFFLHERGLWDGIWIAVTQSGLFISPMVLGVLIQHKGWRVGRLSVLFLRRLRTLS